MPILNWLDREETVRVADHVPYRLLESVDDLSVDADGGSPNMLIQGDNLEALKALLPYYAGQVKCIFIDPPYNTKSAFDHYDDSLEHSKWLSTIYPRLELLRQLLAEDGSIWVTIDDNEAHYLKVIMDEVFGRKNFIANCIWQKRYSRENREAIGDAHDHILVFSKSPSLFKEARNKVPITEDQAKIYKNPNNHPRGRWRGIPMTAQGYRPNQMYDIVAPGGAVHRPPEGRCWSTIEGNFLKLKAEGRIYFGKDNNSQPNIIRFLDEVEGMVPWTWWPHEEAGHTDEAKKEVNSLFGETSFGTPKPERLMQRILYIATNENDLILDSFLGSGTTAAVAHKMGRRYIGIEMGEHAVTHCQPRLQKVVEGEQGGISEAVGWKGGGSFRFYKLGSTIFNAEGNINPDIRFPHLAAHIWFCETKTAYKSAKKKSPLLGVHDGTAYYLLYNGILGDKAVNGGNVLTHTILKQLPEHDGPKVIYGETSRISPAVMKSLGITFKQTPYDVKAG